MVNLNALPKRVIITGVSGAGKTTYCQQVIEAATAAGWRMAGILSLPRFQDGRKTGIFVVDLVSREKRLLASCLPDEIAGMRFGKWDFDTAVLDWGNDLLRNVPACDLLVVDEIGPLEFDCQQGWSSCFQAISIRVEGVTLATVRPSYLQKLQTIWPASITLHVETQK